MLPTPPPPPAAPLHLLAMLESILAMVTGLSLILDCMDCHVTFRFSLPRIFSPEGVLGAEVRIDSCAANYWDFRIRYTDSISTRLYSIYQGTRACVLLDSYLWIFKNCAFTLWVWLFTCYEHVNHLSENDRIEEAEEAFGQVKRQCDYYSLKILSEGVPTYLQWHSLTFQTMNDTAILISAPRLFMRPVDSKPYPRRYGTYHLS